MAPIPVIKIVGPMLGGNSTFSNSSAGNTVGGATSVYIYNGNTAAQIISVANAAAGTNVGSVSVPPATAIILRKYTNQTVFCGDTTSNLVTFTPIAALD